MNQLSLFYSPFGKAQWLRSLYSSKPVEPFKLHLPTSDPVSLKSEVQ
jgi:hypothetical protein